MSKPKKGQPVTLTPEQWANLDKAILWAFGIITQLEDRSDSYFSSYGPDNLTALLRQGLVNMDAAIRLVELKHEWPQLYLQKRLKDYGLLDALRTFIQEYQDRPE